MTPVAVAEGVWRIGGWPPWAINAYLVAGPGGDILIDACTSWDAGAILRQLRGRRLEAVALTHCHPDHTGAVAALRAYARRPDGAGRPGGAGGVPLWCHELDADAVEGAAPVRPDNALVRLGSRLWASARQPVARRLRDGDRVGEWVVVHAPGHTPGHVLYWRERDGLVIAGDVLRNRLLPRWLDGLREPPAFFSADPAQNRRSVRRLLDLRPRGVLFGHGVPLWEPSVLEACAVRLGVA